MKVIWKGLQFPLNRSTQHINLATERKIVQIKSIELKASLLGNSSYIVRDKNYLK